jgi:hypothetical protein
MKFASDDPLYRRLVQPEEKNMQQPDVDPTRPPTFGEKAVGLSFNPSGDPAVHACKAGFAALIDQMEAIRNDPKSSSGKKRHAALAITMAEDAQMRAVKAITWRD